MPTFMRQINVTARCATQYRDARFADSGINASQSVYVLCVCQYPGMTQERIAQLVHVNKSNAARQLALLERNGFVERRPSENDRRSLAIYPTDRANAILPLVQSTHDLWNEFITADLSDEEQALLKSTLSKIVARAVAWQELMADSAIEPKCEQLQDT